MIDFLLIAITAIAKMYTVKVELTKKSVCVSREFLTFACRVNKPKICFNNKQRERERENGKISF